MTLPVYYPSFSPIFHTRFSEPSAPQIPQKRKAEEPVLFNDPKYQKMDINDFIEDKDFKRCQSEYDAVLKDIVRFVKHYAAKVVPAMSEKTVSGIEVEFQKLMKHVSDMEEDYFGSHKEVIFGAAKERFHEFERLLQNGKIPLQTRMNAIQKMALDMPMCAGGVMDGLEDALSDLQCSIGGLKGAAYQVKRQMIRTLILGHVQKNHVYPPPYEKHFIAAYFNKIADAMGMQKMNDPLISLGESEIDAHQYETCRQIVFAKLKPGALAVKMADSYLDRIRGAAVGAHIDVAADTIPDNQVKNAFDVTRALRRGELDAEFGKVNEERYLRETDSFQYRLARKSVGLAVDFMQGLRESKLVDYNDVVVLHKGSAEDGDIMQLGDLFWINRNGDCTELQVQDLLNVAPRQMVDSLNEQGIPENQQWALLQAVVEHVHEAVDDGKLDYPDWAWLAGFVELFTEQASSDKDWIRPVLTLAVVYGFGDLVEVMINAGANIDAQDADGWAALAFAADYGHEVLMQALIKAGANVNLADASGCTPLHRAAETGLCDAMQILIAAGACVDAADGKGNTPLIAAAKLGHEDAVRDLLAAEAELEVQDKNGNTVLAFASASGHAGVVEILLRNGAQIDARNRQGMSPLMLALINDNPDVAAVLIRRGARVDLLAAGNISAAMLAAENNHTDILDLLIGARANLDFQDDQGNTALMYAVVPGHIDIVKKLIAAGASLDLLNDDGVSAEDLAAREGYEDIVRELAVAGEMRNRY